MADKIQTYGRATVTDYFVDLQVWGTPEQCHARIADIHRRVGNSHFVGVFSYAGMPPEEAERNMRLFAREVMPEVRKIDVGMRAAAAPVPAPAAATLDVGLLGT
jgi:alkanesulfonate monooxygenase SsuD/methylene tetrahydromethanopterin reductase-like flavin-dependent oxidoreductase (luciferase family)